MSVNEIKAIVEELNKLIKIENYVGESIETENASLIPVMRTGIGFGSGSNVGDKKGMQGSGAGVGVEPVSMVVILKGVKGAEGIRVLNLSKGSDLNKALSDLTPVLTEIVKEFLPKDEEEDYDEGEYIPPEHNKINLDEDFPPKK
ncbi:MAG: sporulation protein [Methanobacteriaceae archaeon]|jgi:uncharacterized spore protein YtfJ|nr:sporulation protein [Methanobacteriaceae archaeon]